MKDFPRAKEGGERIFPIIPFFSMWGGARRGDDGDIIIVLSIFTFWLTSQHLS